LHGTSLRTRLRVYPLWKMLVQQAYFSLQGRSQPRSRGGASPRPAPLGDHRCVVVPGMAAGATLDNRRTTHAATP